MIYLVCSSIYCKLTRPAHAFSKVPKVNTKVVRITGRVLSLSTKHGLCVNSAPPSESEGLSAKPG